VAIGRVIFRAGAPQVKEGCAQTTEQSDAGADRVHQIRGWYLANRVPPGTGRRAEI